MEKRILLIDDDEDELEIFKDALNKIPVPFTCTQVTNTEDAVEWVQHTKPDFVFIDLNMPKINGLECLVELKKVKGLDDAYFIIYSNYIDENIERKAMTMGAVICMKKPNLTSTLAQRLKEILQSHKSST